MKKQLIYIITQLEEMNQTLAVTGRAEFCKTIESIQNTLIEVANDKRFHQPTPVRQADEAEEGI